METSASVCSSDALPMTMGAWSMAALPWQHVKYYNIIIFLVRTSWPGWCPVVAIAHLVVVFIFTHKY